MQVRQDKYNVTQSQRVQVVGKGSDVRLDLKLDFNTKQPNFGSTIIGTLVDSNNKPIQGAVVKLMDDKLQPLTNATTDANGNYSIDSIPYSSMYNMIAVAPGKLIAQVAPFTLLSGQNTTVNFTLQTDTNATLGAISGTIVDNTSKAISGAIVLLYSVVSGVNTLMAITYTDTSGIFVFSELNPGSYSVTITALGYLQGNATSIVQSGIISTFSKALNVNPQAANGIVSGVITDSTNNPVVSADVILYNIDNNNILTPVAFTRTNSAGIYTFINVPAGNYLVKSNQSQLITVNTGTAPTTINSSTSLPTGTYNAALGSLTGGATIDSTTNYIGYMGGPTDGSSAVIVNVALAGAYNIAVKYIAADVNRPMKVDVNGVNTGTIYSLPKTAGWTTADALTYTIPVNLVSGNNTIKFHGDGTNYAPSLGLFTVTVSTATTTTVPTITTPTIVSYSYNVANGVFANGARLDSTANLASYLGGPSDGSSTLGINIAATGMYNLLVSYRNTNRPLKIDINGVNTGTVYNFTGAATGVFTIPLSLNAGVSTLVFHGDGTNYAPDLGAFTLATVSTTINSSTSLPTGTYNAALGTLTGGAAIDSTTNYIGYMGGPTDGSSAVIVNVALAGAYNIAVKYIAADVNRPMKVDVNGVNTGTIYSLPKTAGWTTADALTYTIPVNLVSGNNTIKFHGDGTNYAPSLGLFTVAIPTAVPVLSYSINKVFNGTSDYLDVTNDLSKVQNLTAGAIVVKFKSTTTLPSKALFSMADTTDANTKLAVFLSSGTSIGRVRYEVKQNTTQLFGYNALLYLNDGNLHTALISVGSRGVEGYIDGVNVYTVPTSNNFFADITGENNMNIGRLLTSSGSQWYFNGTIEYVDIYGSELTVAQAKAMSMNSYKEIPVLPSDTYNVLAGSLIGGATIDETTDYTGYMGGPTDGSSIVTVNVASAGMYNIAVKYIAADVNRPMKVDINGVNTGTIYSLPKTAGWTTADALSYTIPVNLVSGNNTIKFHGDGTNYAPSLGLFTVSMASTTVTSTTTPIISINNLALNKPVVSSANETSTLTPNFVTDGDTTSSDSRWSSGNFSTGQQWIYINLQQMTQFDTVKLYWEKANAIIYRIEVSNDTTNWTSIYRTTQGAGEVETVYLNAKQNAQYVRIYCEQNNTAVWSTVSLYEIQIFNMQYAVALGSLSGGAAIDTTTNYAGYMGGPTDGSSIVTANVVSSGAYNIWVKYIAADVNRPMKVDINGVNTGTIYSLPKTAGWTTADALSYTIPVNLVSGNNTIKFHGDGTNYAPSLGLFTTTPANIPTTTTLPLGFMTNGARVVSTGAVGWIGGPSDGSVFINYNASQAKNYSLTLTVQGNNSPLAIDINGISTGTIYKVTVVSPATLATLSITAPLSSGNNTVKFHGDGTNYGPDLFTVQIN